MPYTYFFEHSKVSVNVRYVGKLTKSNSSMWPTVFQRYFGTVNDILSTSYILFLLLCESLCSLTACSPSAESKIQIFIFIYLIFFCIVALSQHTVLAQGHYSMDSLCCHFAQV